MRIWIERTAGWAVSYFQEAVDMVRMNDGVAAVVQECVDLMAITGGDAFRVRTYEKAARSVGQMKLLRGTELNIGPEGGLDWPDEFLTGFDLCVASVHSHFSQPCTEMTRQLRLSCAQRVGDWPGPLPPGRPAS